MMIRRMVLAVIVAFLPVMAAFGVALLFQMGVLPNMVLLGQYHIDLAGLISRFGMLASFLLIIVLSLILWAEYRIDQVRMEEQAINAESRRRFLQRLDHELKNPLTIIRLGVVNLQQSPNLDADQTASLVRVGQQTQRLGKLVQDLRWLGELGSRGLEHQAIDLAGVLDEAIMLSTGGYEGTARPINLNIQQVPWPLGYASGDRDLLVLAFRNLIDNALKFSTDSDQVEVRATDDGHVAVVEVADSGAGIPSSDLPHIFEELYRGDNARGVAGSGLGLTLVERIIALHGGQISLRSRAGQGTAVTVRLPLAPPNEN